MDNCPSVSLRFSQINVSLTRGTLVLMPVAAAAAAAAVVTRQRSQRTRHHRDSHTQRGFDARISRQLLALLSAAVMTSCGDVIATHLLVLLTVGVCLVGEFSVALFAFVCEV